MSVHCEESPPDVIARSGATTRSTCPNFRPPGCRGQGTPGLPRADALAKTEKDKQLKISVGWEETTMTDDELIEVAKNYLAEVNAEQKQKYTQHPEDSAKYIAHGTHISSEDFLLKVDGSEYAPIFAKETQNELNAIKELSLKFPELEKFSGKELLEKLNIPARLFGIPTKKDTVNEPIPQDGSYAYAIKKCSSAIAFTDDGIPLLIGSERKYKKFEKGENKGHIYVVEGKDFRPEYDACGVAAEYITEQRPKLVKHIEVTPKEAMAHNTQFVVFTSPENEEKWFLDNNVRAGMSKDSDSVKSLAAEVSAGRAVYINASERGINPRLPLLENAELKKNEKIKTEKLYWAKILENVVLPEIRQFSQQPDTGMHGITHTEMVGLRSIDLALAQEQNPLPIVLAVGLHDCARKNDDSEKSHAENCAPIADEFLDMWNKKYPNWAVSKTEKEQIVNAVVNHTTGSNPPDNVAACLWDADRIRLSWQTRYKPKFINTERGHELASMPQIKQEEYIRGWEQMLKEAGVKTYQGKLQRPDWDHGIVTEKDNTVFCEAVTEYTHNLNINQLQISQLVRKDGDASLQTMMPEIKCVQEGDPTIISYQKISGEKLSDIDKSNLTPEQMNVLAGQIGQFLGHLHNLPREGINNAKYSGFEWEKRDKSKENCATFLADFGIPMLQPTEAFAENVVCHCNMDSSKVIVNPDKKDGKMLCGVNEIGSVAQDNKVKDFMAFYIEYGRKFARTAVQEYNAVARKPLAMRDLDYAFAMQMSYMCQNNPAMKEHISKYFVDMRGDMTREKLESRNGNTHTATKQNLHNNLGNMQIYKKSEERY